MTDTRRLVHELADIIRPTAAALPNCALTSLLDLIGQDPDKAVTIAAHAVLALALPPETPALRDNAGLTWYPVGQPHAPLYSLGEHNGALTRHEIDIFHGPLTELHAADDHVVDEPHTDHHKTERLHAPPTTTNLTARSTQA